MFNIPKNLLAFSTPAPAISVAHITKNFYSTEQRFYNLSCCNLMLSLLLIYFLETLIIRGFVFNLSLLG